MVTLKNTLLAHILAQIYIVANVVFGENEVDWPLQKLIAQKAILKMVLHAWHN